MLQALQHQAKFGIEYERWNLTVSTLIVYLVFQAQIMKGMIAGSVKG